MTFWIALAVLLIAVVVGTVFVVIRGLQLYREAKRVGGVLGAEVDRINVSAARIEVQLRKADEAKARLQEAADRLAVSRAKLNVQVAAVREARAQVRRVFWFVPGI
jgi:predicted DNA-binding protein (UPF0251 family)